MAFPGAAIFEFGAGGIEKIEYEQADAVRLTKSFLQEPQAFLRHLFEP